MRRFDGVRSRTLVNMMTAINEFEITARGEVMILMTAVTRFIVKRSETFWKEGSRRWKQDEGGGKTVVEELFAAIMMMMISRPSNIEKRLSTIFGIGHLF